MKFRLAPDFDGTESANKTTLSNWDMEHGYNHTKDVKSYPYRVFGTGRHASFSVVMRMLTADIDHLCRLYQIFGFFTFFEIHISFALDFKLRFQFKCTQIQPVKCWLREFQSNIYINFKSVSFIFSNFETFSKFSSI